MSPSTDLTAPERTPPDDTRSGADQWITPPRRSALITSDNSQQSLDGIHTETTAWMWAPVTDGERGAWRHGYTTWPRVFGAVGAWLREERS